jgi:hypothetical protein
MEQLPRYEFNLDPDYGALNRYEYNVRHSDGKLILYSTSIATIGTNRVYYLALDLCLSHKSPLSHAFR